MTIFELLAWVFTVELPKAEREPHGLGVSSWNAVERFGFLGTLVDEPDMNCYSVVPDNFSSGLPHADALAVYDFVGNCDSVKYNFPANYNPVPDLGNFENEIEGAMAQARERLIGSDGFLRFKISEYIRHHAVVGSFFSHEVAPLKRELVLGAKGEPRWFMKKEYNNGDGFFVLEVDGFDPVKRRPMKGAYQKYKDNSLAQAIAHRMKFQIYLHSLEYIYDQVVAAGLSRVVAKPSFNHTPWVKYAVSGCGELEMTPSNKFEEKLQKLVFTP